VLKGLVLAGIGFAVFLVAQVLVLRWRQPQKRFFAMVRLIHWVGALVVCLYAATSRDLGFLPEQGTGAGWVLDLMNGLLVLGFLFVGYAMFYFLVDRGFSVRILIEIETSPERRLRQSQIAERYPMETVLNRRLTEMVEIGRVSLREGRYVNTVKGACSAAGFALVKKFMQLGEGG
jgi:hypothetical protein